MCGQAGGRGEEDSLTALVDEKNRARGVKVM
jgi:hypothetical protein